MRRPRKPVPPNTVTVRPFVATMTQIASLCRSFSLLVVEEPIRAIEQPINLARHDEVVLMQSFDLLGVQRDSRITPAECLGDGLLSRQAHRLSEKRRALPGNCRIERSSGCGGPPAVGYCLFAGAPGSTAATPSGLMLKAKNINGSLPGFPHWCTRAYGS